MNLKKILILCLVIFGIVMVSLGIYTHQSLTRATNWVSHTHSVISQLDKILLETRLTEIEIRNYVITGNQHDADNFDNRERIIRESMKELKLLIKDNPQQNVDFVTMSDVIEQKIRVMREGKQARDINFELAKKVVEKSREQGLFYKVSNVIEDMRRKEYILLEDRQTATTQQIRVAAFLFGLFTLGGIGVGLLLVRYQNKIDQAEAERELLQEYTENLKKSNNELAKYAYMSIKILLIENDPHEIQTTKEAFVEAKVANRMKICTEAQEAIDYLLFSPQELAPDLILLEAALPNAKSVLEVIKNNEKLKGIPKVILSEAMREVQSDEMLGNYTVTKPMDLAKFLAVVQSISNFWLTVVNYSIKDKNATELFETEAEAESNKNGDSLMKPK